MNTAIQSTKFQDQSYMVEPVSGKKDSKMAARKLFNPLQLLNRAGVNLEGRNEAPEYELLMVRNLELKLGQLGRIAVTV